MSSAIVRFEDDPEKLIYCKSDSYPAGLGFDLLKVAENADDQERIQHLQKFFSANRFAEVDSVPTDIQYEYIVMRDGEVSCQECWHTSDVSYHGGGFRRGGTYDLRAWLEKIRLQKEYAYRRPEAWKD